jgi:hypothetical protein
MEKKELEELENLAFNMEYFLIEDIENTADWRKQKAYEYPDDAARNLSAQKSLLALAEYIRNLPSDHPLFLAIAKAWINDNTPESAIEDENAYIRMYGFQMEPDPEWFIEFLMASYSSALSA